MIDVKIYVSDIATDDPAGACEKLYRTACGYARKRADACKRPIDKLRTLAAFELLRLALGKEGRGELMDTIAVGEYGKPFFDVGPDEALTEGGAEKNENARLYFNISHSGDRVMCVLSPLECGCDVERIKVPSPDSIPEPKSLPEQGSGQSQDSDPAVSDADAKIEKTALRNMSTARRFFTESEADRIEREPEPEGKIKMFTRIWTLKESYIKCDGRGLKAGLDTIDVFSPPEGITFRELSFNDGYCYSCCIKSAGDEIDFKAESLKVI